jgi:hypothetical protein
MFTTYVCGEGKKWQGENLTIHLHLVTKSSTVDLHLNSHVPFGIVRNHRVKNWDNFYSIVYAMGNIFRRGVDNRMILQ